MASRQIVCTACLPRMQEISRMPDVVEAGETMRVVEGVSLGDFVCDNCNADCSEGKPCAAVTVLSQGERLGAWEPHYVRSAS